MSPADWFRLLGLCGAFIVALLLLIAYTTPRR